MPFERARRLYDAARGLFAPASVAVATPPADLDYETARVRTRTTYVEPTVRTFSRWTPADLRAAQSMADSGNLSKAADLCEAILGDDRAPAVLNTRVNAVLGSELTFEAGRGRKKRAAVKALDAEEDWYKAFDEAVLGQTLLWGRLLGVQPVQFNWREFKGSERGAAHSSASDRILPVAETYHARHLRRDMVARVWKIRVGDSFEEIEIEPGDGKFGLFMPYGENRPWAHGLWRGMARWWLLKQYAIDDWGRHSELHGQGIKVGIPPATGDAKHGNRKLRQELANDLANLAGDGVIVLPPGFDFKLVEATADTWQMFKAQIDAANTAMSVMAIGSNLPTEVGNAANTGATAQNLVRLDYKRADNEALSTFTHDQALVWWAEFNYGDRGLAPWARWGVEPAADLKARADLVSTIAEALKGFAEAVAPVDASAVLEEFEIPIKETPIQAPESLRAIGGRRTAALGHPSQPRDDHGKWTTGSGSGSGSASAAISKTQRRAQSEAVAEADEHRAEAKRLDKQIARAEKDVGRKQERLEAAQKEASAAGKRVEEADDALSDAEDERDSLIEEVSAAEGWDPDNAGEGEKPDIAALRERLAGAESRFAAAKAASEAAHRARDKAEDRVELLEGPLDDAKSTLDGLKEERGEALEFSRLADEHAEALKLPPSEYVASVQGKYSASEVELDRARDATRAAQREFDAARAEARKQTGDDLRETERSRAAAEALTQAKARQEAMNDRRDYWMRKAEEAATIAGGEYDEEIDLDEPIDGDGDGRVGAAEEADDEDE